MWLLIRACLLSLVLPLGYAYAQPKPGDSQPNSIEFGTIHTDAIAEASFLVFGADNDDSVKLDVTAPEFVKIRKQKAYAQPAGTGIQSAKAWIELSIDTSMEGDLAADIEVTFGTVTATIPVSATVKQRHEGQKRLLTIDSPFTAQSTQYSTMFKAWRQLVDTAGIDANYMLVDPQKPLLRDIELSRFDTVLLADTGLMRMKAEEATKLQKYVEAGGRLIVFANNFFQGSVEQANIVLSGSGLKIRDEEFFFTQRQANRITNVTDFIVEKDALAESLASLSIDRLRFRRSSPVEVTDPLSAKALVKAGQLGKPGDGFIGIGKVGSGEMIAVGQSLWCYWISEEQANGMGNAKLLEQLIVNDSLGTD